MKIRYFSALFIIVLSILSCKKPEDFPIVPSISYKNLLVYQDLQGYDSSVTVFLNFTDGDGDIGYKTDNSNGSIYDDPSSPYYDDYVAHIEWYHNKIWTPVITSDTNSYGGRLPYLTPDVTNKSLKGEIQCNFLVDLTSLSIHQPVVNDTFRFDIFIYDRALHKSNIVSTPQFILNTH